MKTYIFLHFLLFLFVVGILFNLHITIVHQNVKKSYSIYQTTLVLVFFKSRATRHHVLISNHMFIYAIKNLNTCIFQIEKWNNSVTFTIVKIKLNL